MAGMPVPARENPLPDLFAEGLSLTHVEVWNKVRREPELMRACERNRFRGALSNKVILPDRVAVCLKDFETGLRAAGLIAVDEILCQSFDRPAHLRVQKRDVAIDGHLDNPPVKAAAPSGPVPSLTGDQKPETDGGPLVKGLSEAPLYKGSRPVIPNHRIVSRLLSRRRREDLM